MTRFVVAACLLSLVLCSVGCRICPTPHDYRISAYIDRCDDYRGFNPMYRAGSISGGTYHVVRGTHYGKEFVDYYDNAGNYGVTTPVTMAPYVPRTDTFENQPNTERTPIGMPLQNPSEEDFFPTRLNGTGNVTPVEDLLNPQRGTTPMQMPTMPQMRPRTSPPEDTSIDTIPFSPSDAIPTDSVPSDKLSPPSTFPKTIETDDLPITLEELRRLDPSIQDVEIISIEDAASGTVVK